MAALKLSPEAAAKWKTIKQVADLCGISAIMVRKIANEQMELGNPAYRKRGTGKTSPILIRKKEVERLARIYRLS
jgi:hypothetical protein